MLGENTLIQHRYLVKNLIGRGGMGAVYLVEDTRFNNRVLALKEMTFSNNAKVETAFGREANLLAQLNHPRLPKVSDYFNENGGQYLVMEYVAGEDLEKLLKRNGSSFPLKRVLNWADSLLDILEYLHSHNPPVIHRDIKPQNIKLNNEDKIILLDFGLAKDTETQLAYSKSLVGFTPNFAPLEQIRGDRTTIQTDLYAFSATIYYLLTNAYPASSLNRVQAKIDEIPDPLIPPHQLNPEVPAKLSQVLMYGLTLKQEGRPPTASDMRRIIREVINEQKSLQEMPTQHFNYNQPVTEFNYSQPTGGGNNQSQIGNNQSQAGNNQPTISLYSQPTYSQETVKNFSGQPVTQVYQPKSFADVETPSVNVPSPEKAGKKNSIILFGALIGVLGVGIIATFFVGQWISTMMSSDGKTAETKTAVQEGSNKSESNNKVDPNQAAASTGGTGSTTTNSSPEIKTPVVDTKVVQPKKPEAPKPVAPKPTVTKPKPPVPVPTKPIFQ